MEKHKKITKSIDNRRCGIDHYRFERSWFYVESGGV